MELRVTRRTATVWSDEMLLSQAVGAPIVVRQVSMTVQTPGWARYGEERPSHTVSMSGTASSGQPFTARARTLDDLDSTNPGIKDQLLAALN